MTTQSNVDGTAALAICEALLLALADRKIMPEHEIIGTLHDAAEAHKGMSESEDPKGFHAAVAAVIEKIIDRSGSVLRR